MVVLHTVGFPANQRTRDTLTDTPRAADLDSPSLFPRDSWLWQDDSEN